MSTAPGLVCEGSVDGKMRVFSASTGAVLWQYDVVRPYTTVNGVPGYDIALSGGGAVIADGMLYVQAAYYPLYPSDTECCWRAPCHDLHLHALKGTPMELVVVGAAGRTGRLIVEQALDNKHTVTAVVRNPEKLPLTHERLKVVRGDVMVADTLRPALAGKDAVIATLGTPDRSTTTVFSDGIRNILLTANAVGLRRIITMSSVGLETAHLPLAQRLVARFVVDRVFRNIHLDLHRMEDVLEQSDTDWTIVRAPMLTDGPATPGYQSVVGGHLTKVRRVSRANVADYILAHLDDPGTYRQRAEVAD